MTVEISSPAHLQGTPAALAHPPRENNGIVSGAHGSPWRAMPISLTLMPKSAPCLLLAQLLTRDSFYLSTWGCYLIISASADATGVLLGVLNQALFKLISPLAFYPSAPGCQAHTLLSLQGIGGASDLALCPFLSFVMAP